MAGLFRGLIWGFCLLLVAGAWWFVIQQTAFERGQAAEDAIRQNVNRTIAFDQFVRRIDVQDLHVAMERYWLRSRHGETGK